MTISSDRRVLVTGGASGLGLAAARELHASGCRVALLDIDEAALEKAKSELGGVNVSTHRVDVRFPAAVEEAVRGAVASLGGLDTLVVSAGVVHTKPLAEVTEADWDRTLDINLKGLFFTIQAAAPALKESGRGRIVVVGSYASRRGFALVTAYSASKFGVVGLVESLAEELAGDNITVNCVCPVSVPTTGMGRQRTLEKSRAAGVAVEDFVEVATNRTALGRNATEADVVNGIMFFIQDESDFLTGVALDVTGGAHVGHGTPLRGR